MSLYCGIDLHSNNHVVVVIDDEDRRIVEKRLPNDLQVTLELLGPYHTELAGTVVESTFNRYWLVDGLMEAGFAVKLANTAAKGAWCGSHAPAPEPGAHRRAQLISVQSQIWRTTGSRVSSHQLRRADFVPPLPEGPVQLAVTSHLTIYHALRCEIERLELAVLTAVRLKPEFDVSKTIKGVGPILGLIIMLETGDIHRFAQVGNYSSYCRCVKAERHSNGKRKGEGNRKAGNKYLSWAFSEAAHYCVRFEPLAQRFYERMKAKTNGIVAIRATAHQLARASYYMLRDQVPFDAKRLFA